jgi:N-acetylmuramoyl-L-alanine amidase
LNITEKLLTLGKRNRPGEKIIELRAIVLHWLAAANQRPINTRAWFESEETWGSYNYVIGTDGSILRVLPEDEVGFHVGSSKVDPKSGRVYTDKARSMFAGTEAFSGRRTPRGFFITPNFYAIGIGMSHLNNTPGDFCENTLQAASELCADILRRYNKPIDIITTHHEVVGWKDCPRLWTNNPALFDEFKRRVNRHLRGT